MKRAFPGENGVSKSTKRSRLSPHSATTRTSMKHHKLHYQQPNVHVLLQNPQDPSVISAELSRALCITLHAAGFISVHRTALESFQALVEEYIHIFTSHVTTSMQHSRRTTPLPHDFMHALAALHLTSSSLSDDLNLPIPATITQAPLQQLSASDLHPSSSFIDAPPAILPFLPTPEDDDIDPITGQIIPPRQQKAEVRRKRHIPPHFPVLPPAHAYRETPVYTARQTDARRIRERATAEGMEAEKALRKLVKASKSGTRRRPMGGSAVGVAMNGKTAGFIAAPMTWASEEELWRETLKGVECVDGVETKDGDDVMSDVFEDTTALRADALKNREGFGDASEDDDAGFSVNWERAFWRKGNRGATAGVA